MCISRDLRRLPLQKLYSQQKFSVSPNTVPPKFARKTPKRAAEKLGYVVTIDHKSCVGVREKAKRKTGGEGGEAENLHVRNVRRRDAARLLRARAAPRQRHGTLRLRLLNYDVGTPSEACALFHLYFRWRLCPPIRSPGLDPLRDLNTEPIEKLH